VKALLAACGAIALQAALFSLAYGADAARGKQLYESVCTGCHSMDDNRAGPAHRGVYGRKAGLAPGFDYSPAVKKSKVVWNEKTLDRWLANPEAFIPGQKMGISVAEAKDRADLIAYLKEESKK
jgi:cytochrome c